MDIVFMVEYYFLQAGDVVNSIFGFISFIFTCLKSFSLVFVSIVLAFL